MYDGTLFDGQAGVYGGSRTCMMVPCLTGRQGCLVGWNMYDGTLFDKQAGVYGGGRTCMMVPCLTSRRGCMVGVEHV